MWQPMCINWPVENQHGIWLWSVKVYLVKTSSLECTSTVPFLSFLIFFWVGTGVKIQDILSMGYKQLSVLANDLLH